MEKNVIAIILKVKCGTVKKQSLDRKSWCHSVPVEQKIVKRKSEKNTWLFEMDKYKDLLTMREH